ncbi:MAG TPA: hypothetical protein VF665_14755 [Longimicrobium sp.]|jgi:hypothetical protein|uniref:hypothetical protein n=1 Tax=Longimicrobium sp. TaxID=2029185 RepID=UPI002EDBA904
MNSTLLRRTAALCLCAATAACTQGNAEVIDADALPNLVTISAADFSYQAPATIPSGLTTLRLVNGGHEMHHAQLVRLEDGHTVQELVQGMAANPHGPPPPWVRFVGGPNAAVPGQPAEATVDLKAGNYAILCFIPSKDGVAHVAKGMIKPLTVIDAPSRAVAPQADVEVKLNDYGFEFSRELSAGRHTLKVQNDVAQPHELILVRLAPGKTVADMTAWMMSEQGPPPGMPMGGTTLLSTGDVNYVTLDLAPGEYALLCMVPDAGDGKPHVMHGMARQITVR